MSPEEIKAELAKLDDPSLSVEIEDAVWIKLRPHQSRVLPHVIEAYPKTRPWKGRASLLYHSIGHVRHSDDAVALAAAALEDRSKVVRHYACALLAYSLRQDYVPNLQRLLEHQSDETVEDARAAIRAIQQQNHHLFIDRNDFGTRWHVASYD